MHSRKEPKPFTKGLCTSLALLGLTAALLGCQQAGSEPQPGSAAGGPSSEAAAPPQQEGEPKPSGTTGETGRETDGGPAPATEPEPSETVETAPETKEGKLLVEGMEEPVTLKRFEGPDFVTYYPDDMIAETAASGEGLVVRFIANFGGQRNDEAYLHVFLHPEGTTEEGARGIAEAAATPFGPKVKALTEHRYPWSIAEYAGFTGSHFASVALGRHGDRYFHILIHYPGDYGDGFGPRTSIILKEWRWGDDGKGLEG